MIDSSRIFIILIYLAALWFFISNYSTFKTKITEGFEGEPEKKESAKTSQTILYGAQIRITNKAKPKMALFNSDVPYTETFVKKNANFVKNILGSPNGQVWLDEHNDTNKYSHTWAITRLENYDKPDMEGTPISNDSIIRIKAVGKLMSKNRNLHIIRGSKCPVYATTAAEVCTFGSPTTGIGNSGDYWTIKIKDGGNLADGAEVQFIHKNTGLILNSPEKFYSQSYNAADKDIKRVVNAAISPSDESTWIIQLIQNPAPYVDECVGLKENIENLKQKIPELEKMQLPDKRKIALARQNKLIEDAQKKYNKTCIKHPYIKFYDEEIKFNKNYQEQISVDNKVSSDLDSNTKTFAALKNKSSNLAAKLAKDQDDLTKYQCPPYQKCLDPASLASMEELQGLCATQKDNINNLINNDLDTLLNNFKDPNAINKYRIEEHPDFEFLVPVSKIQKCPQEAELAKFDVTKHPQFGEYIAKDDVKTNYSLSEIPDYDCYLPLSDIPKQKRITDFTLEQLIKANKQKALDAQRATIEGFQNLQQCAKYDPTAFQNEFLVGLGYGGSDEQDSLVKRLEENSLILKDIKDQAAKKVAEENAKVEAQKAAQTAAQQKVQPNENINSAANKAFISSVESSATNASEQTSANNQQTSLADSQNKFELERQQYLQTMTSLQQKANDEQSKANALADEKKTMAQEMRDKQNAVRNEYKDVIADYEEKLRKNSEIIQELSDKLKVAVAFEQKMLDSNSQNILSGKKDSYVQEIETLRRENLKLLEERTKLAEMSKCDINEFPITMHKDYSKYIRRDQIPCWGCKL